MAKEMTENRKAILIAFSVLETQKSRTEFTLKEIEQEVKGVKPKTLRYHINSTMNDGKYHKYNGRFEIETVGKQDRELIYALTDAGRKSLANITNQ